MEVAVPRSLTLNQWTRIRPEGGQPIPWNQPFRKSITNIIVTVEVNTGKIPISIQIMADRVSPKGRNILALLRSEIHAETNLLIPYETEMADKANPSSVMLNPCSDR